MMVSPLSRMLWGMDTGRRDGHSNVRVSRNAITSMTGNCIQADSLEQWDNKAEPSIVMLSLPREEALGAVWKPARGSKEKELHGLPVGMTLYRSAAVAGFGGDQTILNLLKHLTHSWYIHINLQTCIKMSCHFMHLSCLWKILRAGDFHGYCHRNFKFIQRLSAPMNVGLTSALRWLWRGRIRNLVPIGSAGRRVIQTSMGSVQVIEGRNEGKWLLKNKNCIYINHLSFSEAVEDSEEMVEGKNNSYPDQIPFQWFSVGCNFATLERLVVKLLVLCICLFNFGFRPFLEGDFCSVVKHQNFSNRWFWNNVNSDNISIIWIPSLHYFVIFNSHEH